MLDIPDIKSPTGRVMMLIEEYMGRPDKFDMTPRGFEEMLTHYFEIEGVDKADNESMGVMYYLRCKK